MSIQTIDHYIAELPQIQRNWERNWIIPYAEAYSRAFDNFKTVLDNQKKADELRVSIAVSLLSLGLAAGLGTAVGKVTLRSAVADTALQSIGRTNSIRLMRAANWVAEHPTRSMFAGEAWDAVAGIISNEAKQMFNNAGASNASPSTYTENPLVNYLGLRRHLLDMVAAAHKAATEIRDASNKTQDEKDALAQQLAKQPLANAPMSSPANTEPNGRLQKDMEIGMFMALVLTKDHLQEEVHTGDAIGGMTRPSIIGRKPITHTTTSKKYPGAVFARNGSIHRRVYDRVGGVVEDHVDTLVRERRYSRAFFYGSMGHDEIQRAERTLSRISERYSLAKLGPLN